jgi:hypothetical protein
MGIWKWLMPKNKTKKIQEEPYKIDIKQGSIENSDWVEVLGKDGYWHKVNKKTGEHYKLTKICTH